MLFIYSLLVLPPFCSIFQSSFNFPITSTRNNVLAKAGDLSANFNVGYEDLSDLGGLTTLGGGLNWSPIKPISFIVSYTDEEGAPSTNQINDPTVVTRPQKVPSRPRKTSSPAR